MSVCTCTYNCVGMCLVYNGQLFSQATLYILYMEALHDFHLHVHHVVDRLPHQHMIEVVE